MLSHLLVFLMVAAPVLGSYECVHVSGTVACKRDPEMVMRGRVKVDLWEYDALWQRFGFNHDDYITTTKTKGNGHFTITGCAHDNDLLMMVDRPDPYIRIRHYCNENEEVMRIDLPQVFVPTKQEFRTPIYLDAGNYNNQWTIDKVEGK
ncbi:unnamed protein product, partial [Mesorhabditis spiculigera]